jgi:hypothetical protein
MIDHSDATSGRNILATRVRRDIRHPSFPDESARMSSFGGAIFLRRGFISG